MAAAKRKTAMPGHLGEFERIARILAPLAEGFPGALGLTDDAALITPPPGRDLAVTTDTMVACMNANGPALKMRGKGRVAPRRTIPVLM